MRCLSAVLLFAAMGLWAYGGEPTGARSLVSPSAEREITLSFSETPLHEVLAFLRRHCDLSLVCDLPVADQQQILITTDLKGVSVERALDVVLHQAGLERTRDGSVFYIARPDRIPRYERRHLRQYPVHDLVVPLAAPQRSGRYNNDNDDEEDEEEEDVARRSSREVMAMILLFTGPQNWDYVGQVGRASRDNDGNNRRRR